jgi:Zn-finger nucleic acid-binding protein
VSLDRGELDKIIERAGAVLVAVTMTTASKLEFVHRYRHQHGGEDHSYATC